MTKRCIVTYASEAYFPRLERLLLSFVEFNVRTDKFVIVNLGMKKNQLKAISCLCPSAIVTDFDYSKHPKFISMDHPDKRYGFKGPAVLQGIKEAKDAELVIWLDSGIIIKNSLEAIWDQVDRIGFYSFWSQHDVKKWTHPNVFKYTRVKPSSFQGRKNISSGIVGVDMRRSNVQKMMNEWSRLCQIEDCVSPDDSSRANHRQDQAILTVLMYKYDLKNAGMPLGAYPLRIGRSIKYTPGLVSVIIPSFNRFDALQHAIESVRKQTYTNWEVVVCNDCSTDKRYKDTTWTSANIKVIHLDVPSSELFCPRSPGYVRNVAIEASRGEWIAFLDDDDVWMPNKIEKTLEGIRKAEVKWGGSDAYFGRGNFLSSKKYKLWNGEKHRVFLNNKLNVKKLPTLVTPAVMSKHNYLLTSGVIVKRHLLQITRYFPLQPCAQDTALWKTLIHHGNACYLPEPLHYYDLSHAGLDTFDKTDRQIYNNKINTDFFGGWSISYLLFKLIWQKLPHGSKLLEFGSGFTSRELAKVFNVWSVEHDKRYKQTPSPSLHPIIAPLSPLEKSIPSIPRQKKWYDLNVLKSECKDVTFDGILIDGPLRKFGRGGVYRFLEWYVDETSRPMPLLFFDDAERNEEKILVDIILSKWKLKVKCWNKSERKHFIILGR